MTLFGFVIIVLVLGVIVGNIMLLKHSAKFSMKNINRDPIEQAKEKLAERKLKSTDNKSEDES